MLTSTLTIVALVYILLCAYLYFLQHKFVYFPSATLVSSPTDIQLPYEDVQLESSQGNTIHGWFIPHPEATATLLFFHGNGGNISHRLDSINIFHQLRLSVFIIDYQGYGRSEGKPSETATYDDALSAWRFLTEQKQIAPEMILIFGRSLGAAVAAWLAAQHAPRALILESAFTSVTDMGKMLYPLLPANLLTRYPYDTLGRIQTIRCPILVLHSPDDEIIPFHFGEQLYQSANEPKQFFRMRGGHNDGFLVSGTGYINTLKQFISTHVEKANGLAGPN